MNSRRNRAVLKSTLKNVLKTLIEEIELEIESEIEDKKRIWVRTWIGRRDLLGASNCLLREFELEDRAEYYNTLRMTEDSFNILLNKIKFKIQRADTCIRNAIPARTKLQTVLYFLATGSSLRTLQHCFRLGKSTISDFIPEVCEMIYESLKDFIKVPNENEWKISEYGFRNEWNFPGCCGAIDGKHVVIKAPANCGSLYFNYKQTNSIVLMAVVDYNYCFKYIDVGCNGRISDGGVFRQCNLYEALENGILPKDNFLVGDNAFPLKEYLLKPFPGTRLTLKQKIFNYRLSRARRVVENAFGIMANKFRIFDRPIAFSPEKVVLIVKACCALHNWLRLNRNTHDRHYDQTDIENLDNGSIIEGSWRSSQQPLGLLPISRTLSNHPNRRSQDLRERLSDYFVGEGSVPWQLRMVH